MPTGRRLKNLLSAIIFVFFLTPLHSFAASDVVISQVYGGGGNSGATLKNDFIELFNRGTASISLTGWSVQYASSTGTSWQVTALGGSIGPGQYYLIQQAAGSGGTTDLPTPDAIGGIAMAAGSGKVALVDGTTALSGSCPSTGWADLVGYGSANCSEGSPTATLTNTTAAIRAGGGCIDTDNNAVDFSTGSPNPRNTSSTLHSCSTSSNPSGTGTATPSTVAPGATTLLTVRVTPGSSPASSGLGVTIDLSSLGGATAQAMFNDGTNGDLDADDAVWSFEALVAPATTAGSKALAFTVQDAEGRSGSGSISLAVETPLTEALVVISQIYGGGGNSGSTYTHDFVELFNRGTETIDITGWSVQYTSATGSSSWQTTPLSGSMAPGTYYLIQQAAGSGGTTPLPTPDAIGTIPMSATAGKVALVRNLTALSGSCPSTTAIADLVGFGSTASCFEGAGPAPAPSNTNAIRRARDGCIDNDDNSTDFFTSGPFPRNSSSSFNDCFAPPPPLKAIHEIQGNGSISPLAGMRVRARGIVTAVKSNGYFIQTPSDEEDADDLTSEGLFVFTSSNVPAEAVAGNLVEVEGTVTEFTPASEPLAPPLTQLSNFTETIFLSAGHPLPAPVTITLADISPDGGVEQLERFEGMRVHIDSLTVVAPTGGFTNESTATATSNGSFFGVISGTPRPFREPGVEIFDILPSTAPCCVPRYDSNPEKIRVNSRPVSTSTPLNVAFGDTVSTLTGVLDYTSRSYTVVVDPDTPPQVIRAAAPRPAPTARPEELTIASFNLERLFDDLDDPSIGEPVLTPGAYQNRLQKLSLAVRELMQSPDIIGVQEVESQPVLQALAERINSDAAASGAPDPGYLAFVEEGNDVGGIDVGFLVKGSRIDVNGLTQVGKDARFTNPTSGNQDLIFDRPPLILRATTREHGFAVTVVVNHLRSLIGLTGEDGRVREKRAAQAEYLASLLQTLQQNENVITVGDFNAFQFSDGYVDVIGTIIGKPAPADQVVRPTFDGVNPDLIPMAELVPPAERYSYVFDGSAQILDHILISPAMMARFSRAAFVRGNSDFPTVLKSDPTRPERTSDHDMPVSYFRVPSRSCAEPVGRWRHHFSAQGSEIDSTTLQSYLQVVRTMSSIFDERHASSTINDARLLLQAGGAPVGAAPPNQRGFAVSEATAAWLNFAAGGVRWNDPIGGETMLGLMASGESILLNGTATESELLAARAAFQKVNTLGCRN
jgi:uncharacterized protein